MKKIISLVLALALAVSLCVIPVSAHAGYAETAGETDRFYEALKYCEENGIYLPEDCTIDNVNTWLDGSVTRGEYATWLARFAGAANAPAATAAGVVNTLDTTTDLTEMAAGTKADGETETVGAFTVHYGAKTKIDGSNKNFEDGYTASQRLNFQGKTVFGDTVSYAVSFTTSAAATVKIWWVAGGDGREFTLFDAEGNAVAATSVEPVKNSLYISELTAPAAGKYYLGLETGSNYLFKLEVAEQAAEGNDELVFADMGDYVGTELYNAVAWGKENGYINGYQDGNFYPEKPVSREEICALIARYFRSNGWAGLKATDNITYFVDEDEFSAYTLEEQNVVDCVKYGIIHGRVNGRFDAKSIVNGETVYTSREQMAAIFFRAAGHPVLTTKAYAEVESNDNVFSVRVNIHYAVVMQIANGPVNASNVAVKAEVEPIPSIGLDVAHVFAKTFKTSKDIELNLADFLDSLYTFEDCNVNVDIDGITFTYKVWSEYDENGNMTVIAMPSDTPAVHEAWDRMLETVEYTTDNTDGAYGLLTNGSYMQIGETWMGFNRGTDDLVIDSKDAAAAKAAIAERFKMTSEADSLVEVYFESGITAAYGAKKVQLAEDVLVQVEGIDMSDLGVLIYDTYDAYQNDSLVIEQVGMDALDIINDLIENLSGSEIDVVVTLG